jgi:biotin-dependent carboxylase-like uncharacterized protein
VLEVIEPGLLSTVQDAGRPGYAHLGVPRSGACDPQALAVANLLLGAAPDAPALEITLSGPVLRALATGVVALAGADCQAHVPEQGLRLPPGRAYLLRAGTTLAFGAAQGGARAYLALPGGIVAPRVLGSAATYLAGGFGGIEGRALRAGDALRAGRPGDLSAAGRVWPESTFRAPGTAVRVVAGPHLDHFAPGALDVLQAGDWEVASQSDRMGLRLHGPRLWHARPERAEIVSQGAVWGAVQVPPDGQPIALLADHQTVGGYPILAVAIRADFPLLGQVAPGDRLRFALCSVEEAQAAYRAQQAALRAAAMRVVASDLWDRLLASAE